MNHRSRSTQPLTITARRPSLSRRAFTLIELLLALTLVGLVAITVFGTLTIAVRGKQSAETNVEPSRTADLAYELIRRDLECATPPSGILSQAFTGTQYQDDRGREADTLLLFTTAPGPQHIAGDGDVRRVEYVVLSPDGPQGDHLLVRRVAHNLLAPQAPQVFDDEVLCRGIGSFTLQYYDGATMTPYPSWDSTQYNNAMPPIVEVTIELDRPVGADGALKTFRFTRRFQVPCGVVQQSNVSGLGI